MNQNEIKDKAKDSIAITEEEFKAFLSATGEEQWKLLLAHAEKNRKNITLRRTKQMEQNNNHQYEEISKQFEEFCHTKGIVAKFKVAFANMAEGTRKQAEADKVALQEVKRQSAEANPEFTEFLHTKGFMAKVKLVIENIKQGAKESNERVGKQIEQAKHGVPTIQTRTYSAEELAREFNEFIKAKGLDGQYVVEITDKADCE